MIIFVVKKDTIMEELKEILKREGFTGKEFSELLGLTYDHYRKCTMNKSKMRPTWVKAFVLGYKLMEMRKESEGKE